MPSQSSIASKARPSADQSLGSSPMQCHPQSSNRFGNGPEMVVRPLPSGWMRQISFLANSRICVDRSKGISFANAIDFGPHTG
jgi:hypothetical protein